MANMMNSQSMAGLNTTTIGIPATDTYTIQGTVQTTNQTTAATQGPGGGTGTGTGGSKSLSQVVVTIKQNNTTIYTSSPGDRGFYTTVAATAGDIISVITTSSATQDKGLNDIQTTIQVFEGVI